MRVKLGAMLTLSILVAAAIALPTRMRTQEPSTPKSAAERHNMTIVSDPHVPTVFTGTTDSAGSPVTIACATCHATKTPDPTSRRTADLDLFHQGLEFRHGDLVCLACHDSTNYDRLRLASGAAVAFADRQQLCEQCHGLKARDYSNGAHGGMNGYWDLARGPRTKNACTQCHDPHAPKVPAMRRTFWTIDRFGGEGETRATTGKETGHDR